MQGRGDDALAGARVSGVTPNTPITLKIDPLVEVIVGLLIVRPEFRGGIETYDQARQYAEAWARKLRGR